MPLCCKSPLRKRLPLASYQKEKPWGWSLTCISSAARTVWYFHQHLPRFCVVNTLRFTVFSEYLDKNWRNGIGKGWISLISPQNLEVVTADAELSLYLWGSLTSMWSLSLGLTVVKQLHSTWQWKQTKKIQWVQENRFWYLFLSPWYMSNL